MVSSSTTAGGIAILFRNMPLVRSQSVKARDMRCSDAMLEQIMYVYV